MYVCNKLDSSAVWMTKIDSAGCKGVLSSLNTVHKVELSNHFLSTTEWDETHTSRISCVCVTAENSWYQILNKIMAGLPDYWCRDSFSAGSWSWVPGFLAQESDRPLSESPISSFNRYLCLFSVGFNLDWNQP